MHLPSIFVYTHDSIGLGEDGPTHQPVEQLAILRAQPNTCAVRPADANETARAWQFAINRSEGPTALVLSRQGLPILDPDAVPADAVERGAYVLRAGSKADDPDVILIGTGSEVSVCLGAAELLEADGVATRVVSAPCLDQFAEQEAAYRDTVLPPGLPRAGVGRGREPARLEHLDRRRRRRGRDDDASAPRRRSRTCTSTSASRPRRSPQRARAVVKRLSKRRGARMSVEANVNERLAALTAAGTSVWLDQIRRSMITGGELERLVRESSLRGETSNPAIFEKAILGSTDYDDQVEELARAGATRPRDLRGDRDQGRPARLRRAAPGVGGGRPRRRLRLARGRAERRARHRAHDRPGARLLGSASTGPT